MKHILFLTNHSFMFWQFRRELVQALLERGCHITIGVPFGEHIGDFEALGCRMVDIPLDRRGINPITDGKLLLRYLQLLRQERPDLVVTYSIKPNIYAGLACRFLRIPYCVHVQGLGTAFQNPGIARLVTILYRSALKIAQVVFFENQDNARTFREMGITPGEKQCVLHGAGINLDFHTMQPYPQDGPVHFLYLGRLMREKGIGELFAAVRRLHAEGEAFFLDLVGFFEDSYKEQVTQLENLGIAKFHGFQADPRPWYAHSHCVVLPSYHEGMSNVLLEGAATCRPLITSDIPGCREAVDDGITGFLCLSRDEESLYQAMKRFLALSHSQREAMGKAGRAKIEAQFDKKQVVAQTVAALFEEEIL